jgi:hypothetical protein
MTHEQHDEVRDREQPFDQPEPAAEVGLEPSLDANRIRELRGRRWNGVVKPGALVLP